MVTDASARQTQGYNGFHRQRLIAESRCAVFVVSPVSPEILKPGIAAAACAPVSVDRAREHADPHPYMDKAPGLSRPNQLAKSFSLLEPRWFQASRA
jgi:hypothetical protein